MSKKTFADLKNEWIDGLEEAKKEDGGQGMYVLASIGISVFTLVAFLLIIGLIVWVLNEAFWFIMGGLIYVVAARIFGWPTPLDALKKFFKK